MAGPLLLAVIVAAAFLAGSLLLAVRLDADAPVVRRVPLLTILMAAAAFALAAVWIFALCRLRSYMRARERRVATEALLAERRRLAADVHDLVMQELSVALAGARTLTRDSVLASRADGIVLAGEQALAGARGILSTLAERDRKPVVEAVGEGVRAAARHTHLSFDACNVPPDARSDGVTLDALVHIAREAVTNAVKHAAPRTITVVLERDEEWHLRVCDDGRGFAYAEGKRGFGLQSMRETSRALGGRLRLSSMPGKGTTVEAVLP